MDTDSGKVPNFKVDAAGFGDERKASKRPEDAPFMNAERSEPHLIKDLFAVGCEVVRFVDELIPGNDGEGYSDEGWGWVQIGAGGHFGEHKHEVEIMEAVPDWTGVQPALHQERTVAAVWVRLEPAGDSEDSEHASVDVFATELRTACGLGLSLIPPLQKRIRVVPE